MRIKKRDGSGRSSSRRSVRKNNDDTFFLPEMRVQSKREFPPLLPLYSERFGNPGLLVARPLTREELMADSIADQVVSAPSQKRPGNGGSTGDIQRKSGAGSDGFSLDGRTTGEIKNLKGKGSPLPENTRSFMESNMGADFSDVRVHTGPQAEDLSGRLQAKAFTYGNDIVFNKGQYTPESSEGKRLLAHELVHTVQQGGASSPVMREPEQRKAKTSSERDLYFKMDGNRVLVISAPELLSSEPGQRELEEAFARKGATLSSEIHRIKPKDPGYFLFEAMRKSQEGEESQIDWDGIATGIAAMGLTPLNVIGPGPWEPPGNQPIPFYLGNQIHDVIGEEYKSKHPGDEVMLNYFPITSILNRFLRHGVLSHPENLTEVEKNGKPDIVNLNRRHLYEIKPKNRISEGVAEASLYALAFAKAGVVVTLGSTSEPGTSGVLPAPGGYIVFNSPVPGVIVYQYRRGSLEEVPVQASEKEKEGKLEFSMENLMKWEYWEELTGLTGGALLLYLIISEGSRLYPPRNAILVP